MSGDPLDGCSTPGCDGDPYDVGGVLGERGAHKGKPLCPVCYARARRRGETVTRRESNSDVPCPPHGTLARYRSRVWRCHCDRCRAAAAATRRQQARS